MVTYPLGLRFNCVSRRDGLKSEQGEAVGRTWKHSRTVFCVKRTAAGRCPLAPDPTAQ